MSLESEQAIVASCLTSAASYDLAAAELTALDFTDERMRLMFELISKFREAGRGVDEITVAAALTKSVRWAQTGTDDPLAYVSDLASLSSSFIAIKEYVRIMRAATVSRQLVECCASIYELTKESTLTAEDMLSRAAQMIPMPTDSDGVVTYRQAAMSALEMIQRVQAGGLLGVSTGLPNLDELIMGFEPGTLNILGGRPSHGKSLYGMDFAHAAALAGPVQIFSMEMTAANLAMRGIASLGGADFGAIRSGKLDSHNEAFVAQAINKIKQLPITIDARSGVRINQLMMRARIQARIAQPKLIVADYLQLVGGEGDNRTAQVGNVSRSLKALAKELEVPVLALAQVNRGVESRPDKRPMSSDLRDSGEIEQDADVIMFTYLDEKYNEDSPRKGIGELICTKQRNGPTGSIFTEFQGKYQRFREFKGVVPPLETETEAPKRQGRGMSSFVGNNAAANSSEGF